MLDELLERQAGVLTRAQALGAGTTPATIRAHLAAGRWMPVFQGVYQTFTGDPPRLSTLWAVVLRAGPGAALSHSTAAELGGLATGSAERIHVTIPADRRIGPIPGVVIHHAARLAERIQPGPDLPRTRIEDTVLDLTELARRPNDAIALITTACGRRLTTPQRIADAIGRRKQVRRRRLLCAVLDDTDAGCHSVLERLYLRDVERAHGLPQGLRQAVRQVGRSSRYEDVHYAGFTTSVELDGRAAHPEEARGRDRRRDNDAAASGDRVLRFGWAEVIEPCSTAAQVAQALQVGGWQGRPKPCRRPDCTVTRS